MNGHTHSLTEWAAFLLLGLGVHGLLSVPFFLVVDMEVWAWPRPMTALAARVRVASETGRLVPVWQPAVYAGHFVNRVIGRTVLATRRAGRASRESCRDGAALLILLTTSPKGSHVVNSEMQPYFERLARLSAAFTTNAPLDEWDWSALFEYAEGDAPAPEAIAGITALWSTSPEGYASRDIALIARLHDGRWATCVAWSDTSGFGCQQGVDWRINDTRELAISQGLDKESRTHLGLSLPGEESTR